MKKKVLSQILKVVLSLFLGGAILYWMYRGFNFRQVEYEMFHGMNWTWMLLSLPFGVLAQAFRGWRWRQTLEPVGETPRTSVSVNSIFVSYASSLVVPRIGEFARCGILRRWDGVSFPKSIGTVVTERAIDSLLILLVAFLTILYQIPVFHTFFRKTGTSMGAFFGRFTFSGYIVTGICGITVIVLLYFLLKKLSIYKKVKECTFVHLFHPCHLAQLFPALLSYLLLLSGNLPSESFLCSGHLYRGQHCRDRTDAERSRAMALCREDDADAIWCGGY